MPSTSVISAPLFDVAIVLIFVLMIRSYASLKLNKATGEIAQVAELVDALVSGTSAERRGGSSPLLGTKHEEGQHESAGLFALRTRMKKQGFVSCSMFVQWYSLRLHC